ncbi:MAG TPA: methyltransferase domain-containing protein [Anaerolineae bacterium]|nr:methyltransferase domain-containing protein [Anaerolineae bacterium]
MEPASDSEHPGGSLSHERFPRSSRYDPKWILDNQMGLNPLWLTEWVCERIPLAPGMRVLDLGCGKGLSSIFLAKEYAVQVWAVDLWIEPTENYARFCQSGVEAQALPIHSDARRLPFAREYFDAVICTDAYIYFGTDDLYLDYVRQFVKPGGWIGISVPGFMRELPGELPEYLRPFWAQECWTWHTLDWWRWHWERTGLVDQLYADVLPDGWRLWLQWKRARAEHEGGTPSLTSDIQVLEADQGQLMGFVRMVARSK